MMTRRQILITGAAVATLLSAGWPLLRNAPAAAAAGEVFDDDRVLGAADAPVTIIEYSSLTCPHCAAFHNATLPQVKSDWIDPGKARFIHRHFPLDRLALQAALLANCLEGAEHFAMLDALFKGWARADDPTAALATIARLAGFDQARFDACISDEVEMDKILARAQDGQNTYDVNATPTLIVNGKKVEGGLDYGRLQKVLETAASES